MMQRDKKLLNLILVYVLLYQLCIELPVSTLEVESVKGSAVIVINRNEVIKRLVTRGINDVFHP